MTTTPTARQSRETMPLRVQRSGIISRRVWCVIWTVQSMLDKPHTRKRFRNDLENVLGEAAHEFSRWLYAEVNGRRKEARRCWEDVQHLVEYQLPMVIVYARQVRKTRRGREKVINEVLPLVLRELMPKAKWLQEMEYAKWKPVSLKRSLKRPDKDRLNEFLPWVKEVVAETLDCEELIDAYGKAKAVRRNTRAVPAKLKHRPIGGSE